MTAPSLPSMNVWPPLGTTVTLESGYVITAAGANTSRTSEIINLLSLCILLGYDPTEVNPNPSPIPPSSSGGAITVATSALLTSALEPAEGSLGITQGSVTANDTGGGQFWFDADATDTVDGALVLSGISGGRWKRIVHDNMLNVRWFGAVGDGVADDTAAIQAALDACTSYAGGIYIPRGDYRITASLKCGWTHADEVFAIRVMGESPTFNYVGGTNIVWDGAASDQPAFWFSGYNFRFEGLTVRCKAGRTLHGGFELGNLTATSKFNSASGWFRCNVLGDTGTIRRGFGLGTLNAGSVNLETCIFSECVVQDATVAAIHLASGQPYNTKIVSCGLSHTVTQSKYIGVLVQGTGGTGNVTIADTDFQNLEIAVKIINQELTLLWTGGQQEHCKKALFSYHYGLSGVPNTMTIQGMRISPTNAGLATDNFGAADTAMFVNDTGGLMNFLGVSFDGATVGAAVVSSKGSCIYSSASCWPNSTPFLMTTDTDFDSVCHGVWSTGDKYYLPATIGGAFTAPLPARHGGINPSYAGALSTITGAATSIAVTLPLSEMINDYQVRLEVDSVTGTPAVGSTVAYVTSKTATGFTITVPVAPGVGNTVVFRYTTWR